jgi:hypothetical protein
MASALTPSARARKPLCVSRYMLSVSRTILSPEAPAIRLVVAPRAASIFSRTISSASARALLPPRMSFIIRNATTPFGGQREWFQCPVCDRRVGILYGPQFACRSCRELVHPSTRQRARDRAVTRAVLLRRQLGGSGSLLDPFPRRPRGMKRKQWLRLFEKCNRDERRSIEGVAAFLERLNRTESDGRSHLRLRIEQ